MNQGEYSWVIDNNLLQTMLTAKYKREFLSDVFQIGHLNWQISAYPNGSEQDEIGEFQIFVKLLTMPNSWQMVTINRRIYCKETESCFSYITSYKKGESYEWLSGTLMLNELQSMNPNELTFIINITILQIKLTNNSMFYENPIKLSKHSKFEWKINKELMMKMRNSSPGKEFGSKIYDNCWCLTASPNDLVEPKGEFLLCLHIFGLPPNTMKISVNWTVKCKELNISSNDTDDFNYDDNSWSWRYGTLSFDQFKQFDESSITFSVEVLLLNIYNNDGIDIPRKNWDKYIQQNDDEKKEQEIAVNVISDDVQQRLDIQQARLDSLTAKLDGMQNYDVLMEEMNNKITTMMTKINQLIQQTNNMNINTSKLQRQYEESVHIEEKKDENLCDNKLMMMQRITALQQQFGELSKMQRNDKKEKTETQKLKSWFDDILGFAEYFSLFIGEGFDDLESMKHITMNELDEIGITKLGHKKKIIREAEKLSLEQESQCIDKTQRYAQQQLMEPSVDDDSSNWICNNCNTLNSPNVALCTLCGVSHRNNNIFSLRYSNMKYII